MKNNSLYLLICLALVFIFLLPWVSNAGWIIKMTTTRGNEMYRNILYIQGSRIKVVADEGWLIFDGLSHEIILGNVEEKNFWKGNIGDLYREIKRNNNDEAYKQSFSSYVVLEYILQQMLMGDKKGMINFYKEDTAVHCMRTAQMATISGIPVRKFIVNVHDTTKQEVWLGENMIQKKEFYPQLVKAVSKIWHRGIRSNDFEYTKAYGLMKMMGFPLKTITYNEDYKVVEVAQQVIEKRIETSYFLIPTDFSPCSLPKLLRTYQNRNNQ